MKQLVTAAAALMAGVLLSIPSASAQQSSILETVKSRGQLFCGVNTGIAGFSAPDDQGEWKGLDVDLCRALSAAIFKDPNRVKYVPLTAKERFTALQSGEID